MNNKTIIEKPPYDIRRIWRKVCMVISKFSLISPSIRLKILKMGGVKVKGRSLIGANVVFDGIYTNLIEIG